MIVFNRSFISGHHLVAVRVEDSNDLPVDLDRVRDPDASGQRIVNTFGDGSLSGARESRQKQ